MLAEYSVNNCWTRNLYIGRAIALVLLALLPFAAAAAEWPAWQELTEQKGRLSFSDGDSVTINLDGKFHQLRDGGLWDTSPPEVPGYKNKTPPHAVVNTPGFPIEITAGLQVFELDLSNKTITPDTTFGLNDVPAFNYQLSLFDNNNNVLPMTDIRTEHFTVTYQSSGVIADKNIILNPATGILTLGTNDDGGNSPTSGLTLFTNLPSETARLTLKTTQDSFADSFQVYFGEGVVAPPGDDETDTEPEQPRVAGDKLILPVLTALGSAYYVELVIEPGTEPPILQLFYAEELQNPDTTIASFFEDGILTFVNVEFSGQRYWGQIQLIQENPYRFRLLLADIDDDDDDNDGIPDNTDPEPYNPTDTSDPAGIAGNWFFRFEIVSSVVGTACEFDDTVSFENGVISYNATGGGYSIINGLYNGPLTVNGTSLSYGGTYPEDGGTTTSSVSLQLQNLNSISGSETWTWTSPGEVPCSNISSNVTATRQD